MVKNACDVWQSFVIWNDQGEPFICWSDHLLQGGPPVQRLNLGEGSQDRRLFVASLHKLRPKLLKVGFKKFLSALYLQQSIGQGIGDVSCDMGGMGTGG